MLACRAAQDAAAPTMGMTFTVVLDSTGALHDLRWHTVDAEQVAVAAMRARPFMLESEAINGVKVSASLHHFASTSEQILMCEQLSRIWRMLPLKRMKTYRLSADGTQILRREGVWNSVVADRVLYSQLVHADDARALRVPADVRSVHRPVGRRIHTHIALFADLALGQGGRRRADIFSTRQLSNHDSSSYSYCRRDPPNDLWPNVWNRDESKTTNSKSRRKAVQPYAVGRRGTHA